MTFNPNIAKEQIINKFVNLSDKYHKLSLLFYELSQSIEVYTRNKSYKEFKEYIKSLGLDLKKIEQLSKGIKELELGDLKKDDNK